MRGIFLLSRFLAVLMLAGLSACGSSSDTGSADGLTMGRSSPAPGVSCAPFARELSGIALYGDAADWWRQAGGRYARSDRPVLGSVLVFRRTARLHSGHVSVVSRILGPRRLQVTQANWVPGELDRDQLVVDVSAGNNWSLVRVWYPPVRKLGIHHYPTYGFILPHRPATRDELQQATLPAARYALDTAGRPRPRARLAGG